MFLALASEQAIGWPGTVALLGALAAISFVGWVLFRPAKVTIYQCTKCGNCSEEHP